MIHGSGVYVTRGTTKGVRKEYLDRQDQVYMLEFVAAHSSVTRGDILRHIHRKSNLFEELLKDGKIEQIAKRRYRIAEKGRAFLSEFGDRERRYRLWITKRQ